jgi:hypothetical protein
MTPEFKDFIDGHRIKLIDENKRAHRYTRMNMKYFIDSNDYNFIVPSAATLETEKLYTLEIAESELNKIAEFESQVFNNMKENGHYNFFEILMEQKEHEKFLKNKYPAVKKAYEQYSLMLSLAQSGEL